MSFKDFSSAHNTSSKAAPADKTKAAPATGQPAKQPEKAPAEAAPARKA